MNWKHNKQLHNQPFCPVQDSFLQEHTLPIYSGGESKNEIKSENQNILRGQEQKIDLMK